MDQPSNLSEFWTNVSQILHQWKLLVFSVDKYLFKVNKIDNRARPVEVILVSVLLTF